MESECTADRIFLEGLRVFGKHGVLADERQREQDFLVDITAAVDTRVAAHSDRLDDTVDYGDFRAMAQEVVAGAPCFLIERLADEIASHILRNERIQWVNVTIRKPTVYADAVPGVTIHRSRTA